MKTLLVNANALTIPLADNSVHCVVTSPPYWGLRDYSTNGQLGLERTPEEYIARMVEVFREVRRVLHPEGVMFLNCGDSYAGSGRGTNDHREIDGLGGKPRTQYTGQKRDNGSNLKPKDLVGIPWRLAFALQADGWWLRSDIIWSKPNPMPESVTDRPTKSHEYIFLMTKSQKYFWDQEGVREEHAPASLPRAMRGLSEDNKWTNGAPGSTAHAMSQARSNAKLGKGYRFGSDGHSGYVDSNGRLLINPNGRNLRTVWTIATQPYSGAHYATFPEALVEKCIRAGTSERGCCPECGKQWRRVVKAEGGVIGRSWHDHKDDMILGNRAKITAKGEGGNGYHRIDLGWQPSCKHEAEPIPSIVFDPFIGSGTTSLVARRLGRRSIGLDLSLKYLTENARKRLGLDKLDAWTRAVS